MHRYLQNDLGPDKYCNCNLRLLGFCRRAENLRQIMVRECPHMDLRAESISGGLPTRIEMMPAAHGRLICRNAEALIVVLGRNSAASLLSFERLHRFVDDCVVQVVSSVEPGVPGLADAGEQAPGEGPARQAEAGRLHWPTPSEREGMALGDNAGVEPGAAVEESKAQIS